MVPFSARRPRPRCPVLPTSGRSRFGVRPRLTPSPFSAGRSFVRRSAGSICGFRGRRPCGFTLAPAVTQPRGSSSPGHGSGSGHAPPPISSRGVPLPSRTTPQPGRDLGHHRPSRRRSWGSALRSIAPAPRGSARLRAATCPPAVSRPPAARSFSPGPGSRARPSSSCLGHSPTLRSLICRAPPAACVRRGSWAFSSRASRTTPSGSSLLRDRRGRDCPGLLVLSQVFGCRSTRHTREPVRSDPRRLHEPPASVGRFRPRSAHGLGARVVWRTCPTIGDGSSFRSCVGATSFVWRLCARPGRALRPVSRRPFSGQGDERLADPDTAS